ncbi:hypothetical protein [Delftia acidovorans]|uniref:hypothetical protein n=1 Tax=Delftia acidovorans TaxID=80866 RepID=UPI001EE0FF45|nr:hypothetical protein [Delftia acidovorans]MCG3786025.1 hypothetical protein [Delftia acidovorans]
MNNINVKIVGDYVNSFIYSGLLFLVKNGGEIILLDWKRVTRKKINNIEYIEFINNCSKRIKEDFEDVTFHLEEKEILDCVLDRSSLNFWPSDFIIYSNILYFSGQNGVEAIGLDFDNKKFNNDNRKFIYSSRAYKLASSKHRGIAIAAGVNGVVLKSINKYLDDMTAPKFLEKNSVDIEWGASTLVVNSEFVSSIDFFEKMPITEFRNMSKEEKDKFNALRISRSSEKEIPGYSWSVGDRLFNMNENNIKRSVISKEEGDEEFNVKEVHINSENYSFDNFDSARSGSFGCVVDLYDRIVLMNDNGIRELGRDLTKWKVFPRAKNYVNHLHMIEDDCLNIKIFARRDMISRKFGISPSNIDT